MRGLLHSSRGPFRQHELESVEGPPKTHERLRSGARRHPSWHHTLREKQRPSEQLAWTQATDCTMMYGPRTVRCIERSGRTERIFRMWRAPGGAADVKQE